MQSYYRLRKTITVVAFLIIGSGIIWYIYYQSKNFINGPEIEIISPENGATLIDPLVTIEGTAERISRLELNGKQIFINENNHFSEKLLLLNGYNIITIKAFDKFKREIQKQIEITLKEEVPIKIEDIIINEENNGTEEKNISEE